MFPGYVSRNPNTCPDFDERVAKNDWLTSIGTDRYQGTGIGVRKTGHLSRILTYVGVSDIYHVNLKKCLSQERLTYV